MKRLIDLTHQEAKDYFLKSSSYFKQDLPGYINFDPMIQNIAEILKGKTYTAFQPSKSTLKKIFSSNTDTKVESSNPNNYMGVNYSLTDNQEGGLAGRPLELIHPVLYVSLINVICQAKNWALITERLSSFAGGVVECYSTPTLPHERPALVEVIALENQTDIMALEDQTDMVTIENEAPTETATQAVNPWQKIEQQSIAYSLEYSRILHVNIADCYATLCTHSIPWALHGLKKATHKKATNSLLGHKIDTHIRSSRFDQTNGISQGSVLTDLIVEIVLGYADTLINDELKNTDDFKILRHQDDYRIFTNSDEKADSILKIINDKLSTVGMQLGEAKTFSSKNVVKGSISPVKRAGIEWQDSGENNAKNVQKHLLKLHAFGQRFPNSGTLRRLVGEFHARILSQTDVPDDLEVQVAIATDIAFVSPATFPAIAGILSHLIALSPVAEKANLWIKVRNKLSQIPHNGYLEIWLQRATQPHSIDFVSTEAICKIVNGEKSSLWENGWVTNSNLKNALDVTKIITAAVKTVDEIIQPEEIELFKNNAALY